MFHFGLGILSAQPTCQGPRKGHISKSSENTNPWKPIYDEVVLLLYNIWLCFSVCVSPVKKVDVIIYWEWKSKKCPLTLHSKILTHCTQCGYLYISSVQQTLGTSCIPVIKKYSERLDTTCFYLKEMATNIWLMRDAHKIQWMLKLKNKIIAKGTLILMLPPQNIQKYFPLFWT